MVERGMIEKFGGSKQQHEEQKEEYTNIERIITSWRLLEQDYEHKEYVGPQPNNNNNNVESSNCHQHCHSYVPGLSVQQFWDPLKERSPLVSWAEPLQQRYEEILHEFQQVALQNPEALHERGNNIWAGALTEDASSYGADWKTLVLCDRGIWDPVNVHLFPRTATAIHECGVPATEVFFASMKPHSVIQPHSDFTNFVLTSHLPLIVPESYVFCQCVSSRMRGVMDSTLRMYFVCFGKQVISSVFFFLSSIQCNYNTNKLHQKSNQFLHSGNNKCRLTIGDETRQWLNGKLMVFDTSILHDAVNDSDETRYILMMRIWHPELSETERHALQYIYDCLNVPDLVSPDEGERFLAERRVEAMHSFPHLAATMKAVGGEGLTEFGRGKKKKKSKDQKRGKISSSSAAAKGFGK